METTLQKNKPLEKSYRHFTIPATVAQLPARRKIEFFYIGKKSDKIDQLIRTFDSGYAADNTERARTMIKRLIEYSNPIPDVIIADGTLGESVLGFFHQFLGGQKELANVPFILDGSDLSPEAIAGFRKSRVCDDIISLNELSRNKILCKIDFWKRIKERISNVNDNAAAYAHAFTVSSSAFSKRMFDIVISLVMMIALAPLFLLIILALKIESKGPVFYISKRAGRGYRIFTFYKFRTMVPAATDKIDELTHLNLYNPLRKDGPVFIKIDNDPRVTKLGAFLRKCSLDELPQLFNVLRGDMSLVGNRPLPLYEAATLTTDEWAQRFMAPAGITGLWQIRKNTKMKMSAEERILLDIDYATKSNFFYDLWIMANTPSAVIQRTNA
jgi:lipopolysaccharide/colanic/teichoic acid biosynthesis glycosyltransferase